MGGRMKKRTVLAAFLLVIFSLALAGCGGGLLDYVKQTAATGGTGSGSAGGGGGGGGGGTGFTFSGKTLDSISGAPVPGVLVQLGTYSTTSAADGSFSITTSGAFSGPFLVYNSSYTFYYITPVQMTGNTQATVFMNPLNTTGYPTHTIQGRICTDSGVVQIPDGTSISFQVFSSTNATSNCSGTYSTLTGYSVYTKTFGSDCLVLLNAGSPVWLSSMVKQNLINPTTTVNFNNLNYGALTAVTVSGDAQGNSAQLCLSTPYGSVSFGGFSLTTNPLMWGLYNPYAYQGYWSQNAQSAITGGFKILMSTSPVGSIGSSVTLPPLIGSMGPYAVGAPSSMAYSAGTLSVSAVAGANEYQFSLSQGSSNLGMILSNTNSVSLPASLKSYLSGKTLTTSFYPLNFDIAWELATVITGIHGQGTFPGMHMGETATGTDYKSLTF